MKGVGRLDVVRTGDDNGVSGIISPSAASAYVCICRYYVDQLAFTFITPLRAENDGYFRVR